MARQFAMHGRNEPQNCAVKSAKSAAGTLLFAAEFAHWEIYTMKTVYGQFAEDADAAFFSLMHHFLVVSQKNEGGVGRNEPGGDRRGESRKAFRLTQRITPGCCWEVPPESAWMTSAATTWRKAVSPSFSTRSRPSSGWWRSSTRSNQSTWRAGQALAAGAGRWLGRHYRARHTIDRRSVGPSAARNRSSSSAARSCGGSPPEGGPGVRRLSPIKARASKESAFGAPRCTFLASLRASRVVRPVKGNAFIPN